MQQDSCNPANKNIGLIIATIIISCFLIWDVFIFIEKEAITAKLLAAGSFILLLYLFILFWIQMFKNMKQNKS